MSCTVLIWIIGKHEFVPCLKFNVNKARLAPHEPFFTNSDLTSERSGKCWAVVSMSTEQKIPLLSPFPPLLPPIVDPCQDGIVGCRASQILPRYNDVKHSLILLFLLPPYPPSVERSSQSLSPRRYLLKQPLESWSVLFGFHGSVP